MDTTKIPIFVKHPTTSRVESPMKPEDIRVGMHFYTPDISSYYFTIMALDEDEMGPLALIEWSSCFSGGTGKEYLRDIVKNQRLCLQDTALAFLWIEEREKRGRYLTQEETDAHLKTPEFSKRLLELMAEYKRFVPEQDT
jgi:hypothetical protein